MVPPDDDTLRDILEHRRVAVIGASRYPRKDAHRIPRYLQAQGYRVIPVNPNAEKVLGEPAHDSLAEVDERIDIVNVFRPSDEVAGIVDAVLERDDVRVLWLQLGIHDDTAAERARTAGITVVEDRCIMVEHRRLRVDSAPA